MRKCTCWQRLVYEDFVVVVMIKHTHTHSFTYYMPLIKYIIYATSLLIFGDGVADDVYFNYPVFFVIAFSFL